MDPKATMRLLNILKPKQEKKPPIDQLPGVEEEEDTFVPGEESQPITGGNVKPKLKKKITKKALKGIAPPV